MKTLVWILLVAFALVQMSDQRIVKRQGNNFWGFFWPNPGLFCLFATVKLSSPCNMDNLIKYYISHMSR